MYDTSECIQEEVCDDWPDSERRRTILQREKKHRRLEYIHVCLSCVYNCIDYREDEGIELQVLSGKRVSGSPILAGSVVSYSEAGAVGGTDVDSIDSGEFQRQADPLSELKPTSTIGMFVYIIYYFYFCNLCCGFIKNLFQNKWFSM